MTKRASAFAALIALPLVALPPLATPVFAKPVAVAVHSGWGAFRDGPRCYAIAQAEPSALSRELEPFASVSLKPGMPAVQLRLSRVVRTGSAVTLVVGGRRFRLSAQGATATSRETASGGSRAIIAAMRQADRMTIWGRDRRSRPFRDDYVLTGAPTAIDAALVACGGD